MAEKPAYQDLKPLLSKVKIGDKYYYLKDADARYLLDSVVADYLTSADKEALSGLITAEETRAKGVEAGLQGAIDALEEKVGEAGDTASASGSLYARIKQEIADRASAITQEVSDRNAAIAAAINALDVNDAAVNGKYVSAVKEVDGKIEVTRADLPVAAEYEIVKQETPESGMASTYYLTKDNVQVGAKINIAKDQFLKEAHFYAKAGDVPAGVTPPAGQEFPALRLVFEVSGTEGKNDIWIAVKDLVDTYTAGAAIAINNNEISVKLKADDPYIEIDSNNQIVSKGIDTAIANAVAAEAAIARAAEQANATAISNEASRADAAEKVNAKAISDEVIRAKAAEKANADDIDALEGRMSTAENDIDALGSRMTAAEADIDALESDKEDKSALKALAYKDSASGTVAGETIKNVKATGNINGTATIQATDATVTSTGAYTPAGNVTGSVVAAGSVTLNAFNQTATDATLTKADYTPEGSVTVNTADVAASKLKTAGTVATFTEGVFTPNVPTVIDTSKFNGGAVATWTGATYTAPTLGNASTDTFVKEGLVATVGSSGDDAECLIFTSAATATAVIAQGSFSAGNVNFGTFNGGSVASLGNGFYTAGSAASKANDVFNGGAMPTFDEVTAHKVSSASFAGTKAEDALVTGVSYDKATANGASFTGSSATISATFAGAGATISVDGTYKKVTEGDAAVIANGVELAVGDIIVATKTVTVQ